MILAALLLAVSAPAPAEAEAAAVERAAAALAPHLNDSGTWIDGKPGTYRLAEAQWRAVQTWAARWLDAYPHARPDALARAGARFGDAWSFSATSLGHGEVLVSVARYQIGNSFILGPNGARGYRLRWSSAAPQQRLDRAADHALSYWHSSVRNTHCGDDCRMVGVSGGGRLPNAANGATRFWIEGYYAAEAGSTVGAQLSLWSWRNGHARPLLVHEFAVMSEQRGAALRGSILHVPSKRFWESLFACGSCFGRETDLRFAIEPGRVRMLAPVSRTPEIDLVDRVFARVLARKPAGGLASPGAVRVIRRQLAERLAGTDPQLKDYAGLVMGWGRWRSQGRRWACLSVDGGGATAFAFDARLTRITEARVLKPDSCKDEGAHKW